MNHLPLVPHDDFDASRMSDRAAQAAQTLVAQWGVPADAAVRLAKKLAVTAEAVLVLRGRGIELSGAGMEFVASECFRIAAEDDARTSPAARSQS